MSKEILEITTDKTTYFFPLDRNYYTNDPGHIWFKQINSFFEVGFDYFGQFHAGPILHIRTRAVGKEFQKGRSFGTVESDKWIGPLRLPLTGVITKVNSFVLEKPQLVNSDPYNSWIIRIKGTNIDEEINSSDTIIKGDMKRLKIYIISELEKYNDPPI